MALISFKLPTNGEIVTVIEDGDRAAVHERAGGFERDSLALWCAWIEAGRSYIDVGAYTGLYTIIACKRGGRALAIEPLPQAVRRIRANASLNGVAPHIMHGAASDVMGRRVFHYNGSIPLTSGGSFERDAMSPVRNSSVEVPTFEIDAVASSADVAAIKIDVEGHECAVLRGALQTIGRCRPRLIVETLSTEAREAVHALLPSYRMAGILDGRNTVFVPT